MTRIDATRPLARPAMRLAEEREDRLVFVQRKGGWAVFLACVGLALALTSLMLFQEGRDLPEWLAVPGMGAALLLLAFAGGAWFSRRILVIGAADPAEAVRVERRTLRGATRRTYGADQAMGVALATRPSGKAHVLLLSMGESSRKNAAPDAALDSGVVFVLGATELGFRDTAQAAAVGSRVAAILQCPLVERGAAAYDAGAEPVHVADLTDTVQRPPDQDD